MPTPDLMPTWAPGYNPPDPNDPAFIARQQIDAQNRAAAAALAQPSVPASADAVPMPPPQAPGIDPMAIARQREAEAAAIASMATRPRPVVAVGNPMHAPVQRYAAGIEGAQDYSAIGSMGRLDADRQAAEREAALQERANREAQTEAAVMAAKQRVRMDDERAALDVAREQDRAVADATKRLADMPSFEQSWEDKGTGFKVGLILAAIASAMTSFGSAFTGVPATDFVGQILQDDKDAYNMKRAALGQNIDAARMRRDDAYSIIDRVRSQGQSEREGELLHEKMRLDQMEGQFKKLLADNKVQQLNAQQMELLGAIEERRAKTGLELDQLRATNPAIRRVALPEDKEAQFYQREAFKNALKRSGELEDAAIKGQGDAAKAKAEAANIDRVELSKYRDARVPVDSVIGTIDSYMQRWGEDIPGYTAIPRLTDPASDLSADSRHSRQAIKMITAQFTKAMTGAGMSDSERERYVSIVEGAKTEDDLRSGLALLREVAALQLKTISKGTSAETRRYFDAQEADARRASPVPAASGGDSFFKED